VLYSWVFTPRIKPLPSWLPLLMPTNSLPIWVLMPKRRLLPSWLPLLMPIKLLKSLGVHPEAMKKDTSRHPLKNSRENVRWRQGCQLDPSGAKG
jgi:hypothetical protein